MERVNKLARLEAAGFDVSMADRVSLVDAAKIATNGPRGSVRFRR